jgi:hypothetical protein
MNHGNCLSKLKKSSSKVTVKKQNQPIYNPRLQSSELVVAGVTGNGVQVSLGIRLRSHKRIRVKTRNL